MVPVLGALAGLVAPGRAARVLDPMAGGGGILAACAELGFDCFGYEVDPRAFAKLTERFHASPAGRAADGSERAIASSPRDDQIG
jgi:DNA modification methylase